MGKGRDDKAGIRGNDEAGKRERDKAGKGGDNKARIGGQNDKAGTGKQNIKRAAESVTKACHIGAQRLLRCIFLLAVHSNPFLAFLSSESVIGWSLSLGSIANSSLSVMSKNRRALSSRWPKGEWWKLRACKVASSIVFKLMLSKSFLVPLNCDWYQTTNCLGVCWVMGLSSDWS